MSQDLFGSDAGSSPFYGSSEGVSSQQLPASLELDDGEQNITLSGGSSGGDSELYCSRCNKTFKTKGGCKRHKILHIQKDSQSAIQPDVIYALAGGFSEEILEEMKEDPAGEDILQSRSELLCILSQLNSDSDLTFATLIKYISDFLVNLLSEKSNVFPQKQYENNLLRLNEWLCEPEYYQYMCEVLKKICDKEETFAPFLFRFVTKMFEKLQVECLKRIREVIMRPASSQQIVTLKLTEKQSLYYALGYTVRYFMSRARKATASSIWKQRLICLNGRILFKETEVYPEEMNEIKLWLDKVNRGGLISVNYKVFQLFLGVELIIKKLVSEAVILESLRTETVLKEVFHVSNQDLPNIWYDLTEDHFSETDSLLFFEKFVKKYVGFSGSAEADLFLRTDTDKRQTVALREDLKRN